MAYALITPDTTLTDVVWWAVGIDKFEHGEWSPVESWALAEELGAAMLSSWVEYDACGGWLLGTHPDVTIRIAGALERDGIIQFGGEATGYRIVIEAP